MGQVEFKDFLWEALLDPAPGISMGQTAENTAIKYKITREEVDRFAELSFSRALAAQKGCFLSGEIVPLINEKFELEGYNPRGIQLSSKIESLATDTHIRPSSYEVLSKIRPAFGGVQTGGNSSAIVDGAAAALVGSGAYAKSRDIQPLARIAAVATVGVPPEIMSISPAPAIRKLLEGVGLTLESIDRFEINEAFGAQIIGVERELNLDRDKLNVNGGAIAIGHPLSRHRHPPRRNALPRTPPLESALWHRLSLHRRRAGNRDAARNPALKNRCAFQIHLTDAFHTRSRHGRSINLM